MTSVLKVDNIQNSSGTSALSIDSSGVVSLPNSVECDLWSLQSDFSTTNSHPTDWARETAYGSTYVGTGMTVSSGVFSFPKTGVYKVSANIGFVVAGADGTAAIYLQATTDNSSYGNVCWAGEGNRGTNDVSSAVSLQYIINVDNTDNVKVRFYTNSLSSGSHIRGDGSVMETNVMFERIADAQ